METRNLRLTVNRSQILKGLEMADKIRGLVLYRGASMIDGAPIVVIATLSTSNAKTGDMVQTWILREDIDPIEAINSGDDESICGDCPLRGLIERAQGGGRFETVNRMRGCYVTVRNAPTQVWKAYHRGLYPDYEHAKHAGLLRGRMLRLGAYGDPVAMPLVRWLGFLRMASGWTGYTHQWRDCSPRWARYIMASVHGVAEAREARARGYRSFRTREEFDAIASDEIVCPASPEGGARMDCATCGACDGGRASKRSIVIIAHGSKATLSGFRHSAHAVA